MIDGVSLTIALKCVVDALEKHNGKRFEFGIKALEQFKTNIYEFPNIAINLFGIEELRFKYPHYLNEILVIC